LQFSLLLSSTLDIFEQRARAGAAGGGAANPAIAGLLSGDLGLLHAVDDRLAAYGSETNTGVRFVAVVDMRGRRAADVKALSSGADSKSKGSGAAAVGLREVELKPVSEATSSESQYQDKQPC
jgi:hypothetical protein